MKKQEIYMESLEEIQTNKPKRKPGFEKGHKLATGRPKGSLGKATRQLKEIQQKLLECYTDDDVESIYSQLKRDKPEALLNYIAKIAPKDLTVEVRENIDSPIAKAIQELRNNEILEETT
jgi:hypothetical protein